MSADGSIVCVLIRRLNLVQPLDRVGGANAAPLARRQPCEGEEPIAGFLEAVNNSAMFEPPFADEQKRHRARATAFMLTLHCRFPISWKYFLP